MKTNDRIFIFDNKEWNAQLASDSIFHFEFVAHGAVPSNVVTVLFNGQPVNIDSNIVNPPESTTNPTGSTPTLPTEGLLPTTTTPITSTMNGKYNYKAVLHASLLFYEAQRAGKLPFNNRISWRGNSMLMDKGENGEDLTGGYFDAGDYVKFGFPMASFTTLLAWGAIDYEDAYIKSGEFDQVVQAIRWSTDYFIKVSFINLSSIFY